MVVWKTVFCKKKKKDLVFSGHPFRDSQKLRECMEGGGEKTLQYSFRV